MTNLEHLIENTLTALENHSSYSDTMRQIKNDINLPGAGITPEQCWEICQYVFYEYTWALHQDLNYWKYKEDNKKENKNA